MNSITSDVFAVTDGGVISGLNPEVLKTIEEAPPELRHGVLKRIGLLVGVRMSGTEELNGTDLSTALSKAGQFVGALAVCEQTPFYRGVADGFLGIEIEESPKL